MLGKLIKHELIQTSKRLTAIYISAAAALLLLMIVFLTKNVRLEALSSISLILIGFATIVVTYIAIIRNFNDSLYGSQGYLTFTLPVRSRDILFSKYIVSFFWVIMSYVIMSLSFIIIAVFAVSQLSDNGIIAMLSGMGETLSSIGEIPSGAIIRKMLFLSLLENGIKYFSYVAFIFFALTLSNTRPLQGHPLFFGGMVLFAILVFNWGVSATMKFKFPFSVSVFPEKVSLTFVSVINPAEGALITQGLGGILFTTVFSVLCLVATAWIMEKKVNVK